MKIFIENIYFVQNSVNNLKLGLTLAPSMMEFDVACWYFYYALPLKKCKASKSHFMQRLANVLF